MLKHIFTLAAGFAVALAAAGQIPVSVLELGQRSLGSAGLLKTLEGDEDFAVTTIAELTPETLAGVRVLVISHDYPIAQKEVLRNAVAQGMGVLLTHDASGSGRVIYSESASGTFPEIAKPTEAGIASAVASRRLKVVGKHPVTRNLPAEFLQSFSDHTVLFPVNDQAALLEDAAEPHEFMANSFPGTQNRWAKYYGGNCVAAVGSFGRGRVVLYGGLPGIDVNEKAAALVDGERQFLSNALHWLAGEGEAAVELTPQPYSRYQSRMAIVPVEFQPGAVKWEQQGTAPMASEASAGQARTLKVPTEAVGNWGRVRLPEATDGLNDGAGSFQTATGSWPIRDHVMYLPLEAEEIDGVLFAGDRDSSIQVKVLPDGSAVEIVTPDLRIVAGVENGVPALSFLEVFDPMWHHTWNGLERSERATDTGLVFSAPVLRFSPALWPMAALPFAVDHEKGYPQPDFSGVEAQIVPDQVCVQVGEGMITVDRAGRIHLKDISRHGRVATWTVDEYEDAAGAIHPEWVSFDQPQIQRVEALHKRNGYSILGDFQVEPRLGVTGMSPGVMREITLQGESLTVIGTPALRRFADKPTIEVAGHLESTPDRISGPKELRPRVVTLRHLRKERTSEEFFPMLPQPVEIFQEELGANVEYWRVEGDENLALYSGPGSIGVTELPDAEVVAAMTELDPENEEPEVGRRLLVGLKNPAAMQLNDRFAELVGYGAAGEELCRVPLTIRERIGIPIGMFLYGEAWRLQPERCPESQWAKIWRDLAMSKVDYLIYGVWGSEESDRRREAALNRMARHGRHWLVSLSEYQVGKALELQEGRSMRDPGEVRHLDQIREIFAPAYTQYANHPLKMGWYLVDEVPQGEPTQEQLTLGYALSNAIYDVGAEFAPEDFKINLITTWFTSRESWRDFLKTDCWSYDPYYSNADALHNDILNTTKTVNTPKNKPMWVTLRSCGPTWYDALDLWFDIRRQSAAAFDGGADSVNYFMYAHWMSDMEQNAWYMVFPGKAGPVGAPRRQIMENIVDDLEMLATAEYIIQRMPEAEQAAGEALLRQARALAVRGRYWEMNRILHSLKLNP